MPAHEATAGIDSVAPLVGNAARAAGDGARGQWPREGTGAILHLHLMNARLATAQSEWVGLWHRATAFRHFTVWLVLAEPGSLRTGLHAQNCRRSATSQEFRSKGRVLWMAAPSNRPSSALRTYGEVAESGRPMTLSPKQTLSRNRSHGPVAI